VGSVVGACWYCLDRRDSARYTMGSPKWMLTKDLEYTKSRGELGKGLMPVSGFNGNEYNNSESGTGSLTIIRLV
jgi:hypothetical protein